jgi:hypothetical protein
MLKAMARKAQQFRYEEERKHTRKKPAAKPAPKKEKPAAKKRTTSHDRDYVLEAQTDGKRPSRKSSRKSASHHKTDSSLKAKVTLAVISPSARARHR